MAATDHIINKEVFEFECMHSNHAFEIKKKFGYDVQYKISGIIDRAYSRLADENTEMRIPLLEIDLGKISFGRLEEEIILAFEKVFYAKLSEKKNYRQKHEKSSVRKEQSSFEIVKFFLLTGRLPWFAGKQDENYLADLFDEIFGIPNESVLRFILLNIGSEQFIERLVAQADALHIDQVIRLLELEEELVLSMETGLRSTIEEIILILKGRSVEGKTANETISLLESDIETPSQAAKRLISYISGNVMTLALTLRRTALEIILKLIAGKNDISTSEEFYKLLEKILAEKLELRRSTLHSISLKERYTPKLPAAMVQAKNKLEESRIVASEEQQEKVDTETVKFYISNAGLVLIANYLPAFFNELKLLEEGNFINKSNQVNAVFLLHYLCTEREEAPEYILPLNKILCGLSMDETLPSSVLLDEDEKKECDELLNEMIINWQKIGNLSIDGLRESFLNREGILIYENTGWKLKVEKEGYDLLLESLPWSFSHIKLSWMQDLIITEW
jgi:Contractile injection system tape measure protein